MAVTILAADKHQLVDSPGDRLDRIFLGVARIVKKRHVRREIRICPPFQSASRQRIAKHLPKRLQWACPFISHQNEWTASWFASKADSAVERDVERLHPHTHDRLARDLNDVIGQSTEEDERDVEAIGWNGLAGEPMGAFEHSSQPKDARRRRSVRNSREKPPLVAIWASLHARQNKS